MRNEIAKKVKEIAGDVYDLQPDCIEETDKFNDLGDSLDSIEMLQQLEDKFHCKFSEDIEKEIVTVGDAVNYLQEHL